MRGLSFAGIIIALAFVGYLQLKSTDRYTDNAERPTSTTNITDQVEQQIKAATEQHMQELREKSD